MLYKQLEYQGVNTMRKYFDLLRVHQYIKNFLIFVPAFFGHTITDKVIMGRLCMGYIIFCLIASGVYIFNDLNDIEMDKRHPRKKERPLASGEISKKKGLSICIGCIALGYILSIPIHGKIPTLLLAVYLILNFLYSRFLKRKAVIDVITLALFYNLRLAYGGCISGTFVSEYLYLTMFVMAVYLGFWKRRREYDQSRSSRISLKGYEKDFLCDHVNKFWVLSVVFYSLWCMHMKDIIDKSIVVSIPLLIIIMLRFEYLTDASVQDDPVERILSDKVILSLIAVFIFYLVMVLYL